MTQTTDTSAIMHKLGEMQGKTEAQFQAMFNYFDLVRADISRVEKSTSEKIQQLENHTKDRLNSVELRLKDLENEDKSQLKQLASNSLSGGISGALITGFIEIIKHIK